MYRPNDLLTNAKRLSKTQNDDWHDRIMKPVSWTLEYDEGAGG